MIEVETKWKKFSFGYSGCTLSHYNRTELSLFRHYISQISKNHLKNVDCYSHLRLRNSMCRYQLNCRMLNCRNSRIVMDLTVPFYLSVQRTCQSWAFLTGPFGLLCLAVVVAALSSSPFLSTCSSA